MGTLTRLPTSTLGSRELRLLQTAIHTTNQQLNSLINQVAELSALVRIEDVKRSDLERRVSELETVDRSAEVREQQRSDTRATSLQTISISASISGAMSTFWFLINHFAK